MSRLELILIAITTLSILFNIFIIAYARKAIVELLSISEELSDIQEMVSSFADHVRGVYEMEMFYGDETLKGLMEHTNAVRALLEQQYGDVTSITEPIEYETQEESDAEEESTQKEKHVLYAGTRRRDS